MITNSLDSSHKLLSDNIDTIHERKDDHYILLCQPWLTEGTPDLQQWQRGIVGDSSEVGNVGFPILRLAFARVRCWC
jgi:hypothetical protein